MTHGDLGCMNDNLVWELFTVFQAVGYQTFMLPCEMGYATLAYYAHLVKLQICVQ